jgi:hypothetical protein
MTSLLITACHSKSVQCLGHLKYPAVPVALADLYTLTYWQVVDAHDRWRRRVSTALLNQWLRKVSNLQYCMPAATVAADATLLSTYTHNVADSSCSYVSLVVQPLALCSSMGCQRSTTGTTVYSR